ncbi:condensation domain-containing protein [Bradyrhizobium ottawaense]|uniref:condensation domain-containing protein n=1 Tax=Bradyrhizobium ottawaense TaxID=931866 RepID=UPI003513743F
MSDEEHVFLLTQHHIVSDGGRLGVLVHELSRLYRAFEAGQDDPLPPLAIQYPDYAAWQRQWLSGNGCRSRRSIGATPCQARPVLSCRRTVRGRPSSRLPGGQCSCCHRCGSDAGLEAAEPAAWHEVVPDGAGGLGGGAVASVGAGRPSPSAANRTIRARFSRSGS